MTRKPLLDAVLLLCDISWCIRNTYLMGTTTESSNCCWMHNELPQIDDLCFSSCFPMVRKIQSRSESVFQHPPHLDIHIMDA